MAGARRQVDVDVVASRQLAAVARRRQAARVRERRHRRRLSALTAGRDRHVRRPTLPQPPQPLLLFAALLRQSLFLAPLQLIGRDRFSAARLRVSVVSRPSGAFLRVLALSPFRSSILKPNLSQYSTSKCNDTIIIIVVFISGNLAHTIQYKYNTI